MWGRPRIGLAFLAFRSPGRLLTIDPKPQVQPVRFLGRGDAMGVPDGLRDALAGRRDLRYDRPVALKVLRGELTPAGPERFEREIRFAARLQHPHILTVHDSGESEGTPGAGPWLRYTMPFVEGESLRDRLGRERQLPVEDALRIATEAARALDYAHQHGVVHRDIKPGNILLTADGGTVVADFGVAR
jgi:serine/threonine-protein kinase